MVKRINKENKKAGEKKQYFFVFRRKTEEKVKPKFASKEEKKKYYKEKRRRSQAMYMKKRDMEQKWQCPFCAYAGLKRNVRRHIQRVHKNQDPSAPLTMIPVKKNPEMDIMKYMIYIRKDLKSCIDSIISDVKRWNDEKTNPEKETYKVMGMQVHKINPLVHIEKILVNKMLFLQDKHVNPYSLINETMTEETVKKIRNNEIDMEKLLRIRLQKVEVYQAVVYHTVLKYVEALTPEKVEYTGEELSDPYFLQAVDRIFTPLFVVLQSGYNCKNICEYCRKFTKKPLHHFYTCPKFIEKLRSSKSIVGDINYELNRLGLRNKSRCSTESIRHILKYNHGIESKEDLECVYDKTVSMALKGLFTEEAPEYNERGLVVGDRMLGEKSCSRVSFKSLRKTSKSTIDKMIREINKMKKDKSRQYAMKFCNPFEELEKEEEAAKREREKRSISLREAHERKKERKIADIKSRYEEEIRNIGKNEEVLEVNTQFREYETERLLEKRDDEIRNVIEYRRINERGGFKYNVQDTENNVDYDVYVNETDQKYKNFMTETEKKLQREMATAKEKKENFMRENIMFYDVIAADPRLMSCLKSVLFYLSTKVPKEGKGAINFYTSRIELIMGIRSAVQSMGEGYFMAVKDQMCSLYGKESELKIAQKNIKTILIFEKTQTKENLDDLFNNGDSDTEMDDMERERNDLIKTLGIDKTRKDFTKTMEKALSEQMTEAEKKAKNYIIKKLKENSPEPKIPEETITFRNGNNSITMPKQTPKKEEKAVDVSTRVFEYVPEKSFIKENSFSSVFEKEKSIKLMMSDPLCMWLFTAKGKLAVFNNDFIHDNSRFESGDAIMRYLFYLSMDDRENEKMAKFFFFSTPENEEKMLEEIEKIKCKKVVDLENIAIKGEKKIKDFCKKMELMSNPPNQVKIIKALLETKKTLNGWLKKAERDAQKAKKHREVPNFDGELTKTDRIPKSSAMITRGQVDQLIKSLNPYQLNEQEWATLYEHEKDQKEMEKIKRQFREIFGEMSFGTVLKNRIRHIDTMKRSFGIEEAQLEVIGVKKSEIRKNIRNMDEIMKEMKLEKEFDILERMEE